MGVDASADFGVVAAITRSSVMRIDPQNHTVLWQINFADTFNLSSISVSPNGELIGVGVETDILKVPIDQQKEWIYLYNNAGTLQRVIELNSEQSSLGLNFSDDSTLIRGADDVWNVQTGEHIERKPGQILVSPDFPDSSNEILKKPELRPLQLDREALFADVLINKSKHEVIYSVGRYIQFYRLL